MCSGMAGNQNLAQVSRVPGCKTIHAAPVKDPRPARAVTQGVMGVASAKWATGGLSARDREVLCYLPARWQRAVCDVY